MGSLALLPGSRELNWRNGVNWMGRDIEVPLQHGRICSRAARSPTEGALCPQPDQVNIFRRYCGGLLVSMQRLLSSEKPVEKCGEKSNNTPHRGV